jgi:hypothetical protein
VIEERAQNILKNAFTQKKRNQRLEKFFKSVFSEVRLIIIAIFVVVTMK